MLYRTVIPNQVVRYRTGLQCILNDSTKVTFFLFAERETDFFLVQRQDWPSWFHLRDVVIPLGCQISSKILSRFFNNRVLRSEISLFKYSYLYKKFSRYANFHYFGKLFRDTMALNFQSGKKSIQITNKLIER